MSKKPKQKAQQAFNQFLFDTIMDKIREVELLTKEINSLKVSDASTRSSFKSLFSRVEGLETAHNCQVTTNDDIFDKMAGLDGRIVFEGKANAHQNEIIQRLMRDVDALQIRLSRAQDMIAECHPSGCIEIKKTSTLRKKAK